MNRILITSFIFVLVAARAVALPTFPMHNARVLVVPQKAEIDLGETIDIDVYVVNCTPDTIRVPAEKWADTANAGYSNINSRILCLEYRIADGHITISDNQSLGRRSTHLNFDNLEYGKSKKYKFKYTASKSDFKFIEYSIELEINGKATTGTAIIKRKSQQAVTPNGP